MAPVSPDLFLDAVLSYQRTAAIKAALALDLFTVVAEEDGVPDEMARRTRASERGIRILCDYLAVQGFLTKERQRYRLTPATSAFLTASSPAWMGSVADFLAAPEMISLWLDDPASYVRNGGSVGLANLAPDHPLWVTFARAMVPFMAPVGQAMAAEVEKWHPAPRRILDVAAGHGMFGIALARSLPKAQITAVDWPSVLRVAQENVDAAGLAGRYRAIPGSAFEVDWGNGYDLVLLANFLHHFDRATCEELLIKSRRSLTAGGRVAVVEFVPNEDRVSPPFPALFAFMMLASTPHGDTYTASQFLEMGRAAGFVRADALPLPPSPQSLVVFEQA